MPDPYQNLILEHVHRYRIATFSSLDTVTSPKGADPRACVQELVSDGWLREPVPLDSGGSYIELNQRAFREKFGEECPGGRLSSKDLCAAYGILAFCCLRKEQSKRILPDEFRATFPAAARPGLPLCNLYIRLGEPLRLGLVQVDTGRLPIRLVRSAHEAVSRYWAIAELRAMARSGRFEVTTVSATENSASDVGKAFEKRPLRVPWRSVVVEGLEGLQMLERRQPC